MWVVLALSATVLTSLLPVLNKQLLRNVRPAMVAWAVNIASLPVLAIGTLFLTECTVERLPGGISCIPHLPEIDIIFAMALLGSAALNWAATLLSTHALSRADASLTTPLLTFNPAFTLLVAWLTLGETPGLRQTIGVVIILLGVYLLEVQGAQREVLAPLKVILRKPGTVLAIIASALWGITTVLEKLAIEHVMPLNGPLVALLGTVITVILLTPGALIPLAPAGRTRAITDVPVQKSSLAGLGTHPRLFLTAAVLAGVAPLFGFTAIALGPVAYVTALFKLSAVLTVIWAKLFLGEGNMQARLLGTIVMVLGGLLVAT